MNATAPSSPTLRFPSEPPVVLNPDAPNLAAFRDQVSRTLGAVPAGTVVYLDLGEVELSASALAALLGPVLRTRFDGGQSFVVVRDPLGRNAWDADAALKKLSEDTKSKLVCVWRTDSGADLVGAVDPGVRATYAFATSGGLTGVTARELAKRDDLSIQAASNRLSKVAGLGLVRQAGTESVAGGGNQFRFVVVD